MLVESRAKNREFEPDESKSSREISQTQWTYQTYKIETIGYGEDNLIDDKNPYSPINRRVDIDIRR